MFPETSLFRGVVAHQRVMPVRHKLRYHVFSLLIDLDKLAEFTNQHRFFSHNRWNLLSLHDRDHGDGRQEDLAGYARNLLGKHLPQVNCEKVMLLTYPRVFGYVFNPLSVYIFLDADRQPIAVIYEVSNTFAGRTNYVSEIRNGRIDQAEKHMIVSPFNGERGTYSFRLKHGEDALSIGVALRENNKAILNTWYNCRKIKTGDFQILKLVVSVPFMTLKVMAGIHFEAAKLWLKGLRPPARNQGNPSNQDTSSRTNPAETCLPKSGA